MFVPYDLGNNLICYLTLFSHSDIFMPKDATILKNALIMNKLIGFGTNTFNFVMSFMTSKGHSIKEGWPWTPLQSQEYSIVLKNILWNWVTKLSLGLAHEWYQKKIFGGTILICSWKCWNHIVVCLLSVLDLWWNYKESIGFSHLGFCIGVVLSDQKIFSHFGRYSTCSSAPVRFKAL